MLEVKLNMILGSPNRRFFDIVKIAIDLITPSIE